MGNESIEYEEDEWDEYDPPDDHDPDEDLENWT